MLRSNQGVGADLLFAILLIIPGSGRQEHGKWFQEYLHQIEEMPLHVGYHPVMDMPAKSSLEFL
jgi:hypothetical protein